MVQQSGGTLPVKSSRTCVVYDSESGHVHHIHQVVTIEGSHEPSESQIEAHAISLAQRKWRHAARFKAMHVPPDSVQPHQLYAVDVKTHKLVAKNK